MNPISKMPGTELLELYEPERIQSFLWEMQKGWIEHIHAHLEGEDIHTRLFFFELLWNHLSEQINLRKELDSFHVMSKFL